MSGPVLGIDLGTTNSVVAVADGGQARVLADSEGRRLLPSVVSFTSSGQILVGYDARERRLTDAENTVYAVKRLIGRPFDSPEVTRARERFAFRIEKNKYGGTVVEVRKGQYALAEISAMVLRECRRIAELSLEVACERAVITVPANFNELQRSATKAAGRVAGLDVLRMLNEPTAAALAYGFGSGKPEKVAVYDLGGGTFDITILELEDDVFEVLATAGDTFLGGEDLDDAVAGAMGMAFLKEHGWDPMSDQQAYERLKAAGEWAKCRLSTEQVVQMSIEELAIGDDGRPRDLNIKITREQVNTLIQPWLQRSFDVCSDALSTAGLSAADIDSVVLVGGSTRVPLCRQMVQDYFGTRPRHDIDPDMVVAQGAAIHGHTLAGGTRNESALGKVKLKKMTKAELELRHKARKKKATLEGVPRQPAFAPNELRAAKTPARGRRRDSGSAPGIPDLPPPSSPPGPPVLASKVVPVKMPRSTIDRELDALAPPDDLRASESLDDLAPPAFMEMADPFGDLEAEDPFAAPRPGTLPGPGVYSSRPDALPPPRRRQRRVPSREPTAPFALDQHAKASARAPERPVPAADAVPRAAPIAAAFAATAMAEAPGRAAPPSEPPPAPPAEAQPVVALPPTDAPILMDVTPHSLGIETAGGFCRRLIAKNAPVPTEQTRNFTTAQDNQAEVAVRICQGESETFADNEVLGEVTLERLPPKPRGELLIEVAFILDANGTLEVRAIDAVSQQEQITSINLRGGLSNADIMGMRLRLEAEDIS